MANQLLPGVNTIPNSLVITAITQSLPMVVTATLSNNAPNPRVNTYQIGMNVKLYVPPTYGMYQANGLVGTISAISGNVFTLNLDSSLSSLFRTQSLFFSIFLWIRRYFVMNFLLSTSFATAL